MNWNSVTSQHVSQACELLLKSAALKSKPRGLVIIYKDRQLSVKAALRLAYCLAHGIPTETKLKFTSGESSLVRLRSLGFRAERLQTNDPVVDED